MNIIVNYLKKKNNIIGSWERIEIVNVFWNSILNILFKIKNDLVKVVWIIRINGIICFVNCIVILFFLDIKK